eukprot:TRINITY_DN34221_c0_g1_i2.p1 TRINITY_DN34221_c0_g1~~TRINITY_DN34221_c0_g1_i2.p1  ORF type:complete len:320 (-),score=57.26 TRINITY_DN34221_c0_g1_i2:46-954(-)
MASAASNHAAKRQRLEEAKSSCLVWAKGPFSSKGLRISVVEGVRKFPEDIQRGVEETWQALLEKKPTLFDGPVWGLLSHEVSGPEDGGEDRELHMSMQRSSYKFMYYTHYTPTGKALPTSARCNSIGLMALTETSDGLLVFGQRSHKLGVCPGCWHCVPAGVLDTPDPVAVLEKELHEELAVRWDSVAGVDLLAMLSTGEEQGQKVELTFRLKLQVTAAEVYKRYLHAEDKAEHEALRFVSLRAGDCAGADSSLPTIALDDFLAGSLGKLTQVADAALRLLSDLQPLPTPAQPPPSSSSRGD